MAHMTPADDRLPPASGDDVTDIVGHPRGTLAIVIIFGVLFLLGWVALYVFRFLEHGAPHH